MALLLSIDTATEVAGVCVSENDTVLAFSENEDQKNHAAFVQPAIEKIMQQAGIKLKDVDAIAVTEGPGSYTGLRVGFATAKGLCYALNKPLITVNTLTVMAYASVQQMDHSKDLHDALYCPMIDARRMEVFMAVYNNLLDTIQKPAAVVLTEPAVFDFSKGKKVIVSGSGAKKLPTLNLEEEIIYNEQRYTVKHLSALATGHFHAKKFTNLAYSVPLYLKEFYTKLLQG